MSLLAIVILFANLLNESPQGLTTAGLIFVTIVWTTVLSVLIFCYRRVLQKSQQKRQMKGEEYSLPESPA